MTIATCPRCQDEISIPSRGRPQSRVQCPLCLEEMRLEEVLSSVPPMLILLDQEDQHEPARASHVATSGGWGAPTAEPNYEMSPATSSGDFLGGGIGAATTTVGSPGATIAASPPRVKKQPSIVLEGMKVVFGGAFGIILAIVVLWYLPGKYAKDIFNVGPLVVKYVPVLTPIVPEKFRGETAKGGGTANNGGGSAIAANTNQNGGGNNNVRPSPAPGPTPMPNLNELTTDPMPVEPENPLKVDSPLLPDPTENTSTTNKAPTPEPMPEPPTPEPAPTEVAPEVTALAESITAGQATVEAFEEADPADNALRRKLGTDLFDAATKVGAAAVKVNPRDSSAASVLETMPAYLKSISNSPFKLQMIGFFGGEKLKNADGSDTGIVCLGTVKEIRAAGKAFEVVLELATKDKRPMTVVVKEDPQEIAKVDERVVVAGVLTEDAGSLVKGYKGEAGAVVVGGGLVAVE